jgi:hypothetical protein
VPPLNVEQFKVLRAALPDEMPLTCITPARLREFLRAKGQQVPLAQVSAKKKLILLSYILSDKPKPSELVGLELLPLQADHFIAFSSSESRPRKLRSRVCVCVCV